MVAIEAVRVGACERQVVMVFGTEGFGPELPCEDPIYRLGILTHV